MKKQHVLTVLGVLVGMGLLAADAGAFSASYDQKTTHKRDTYLSKVSMKDQLFRMEMTAGGQESIIIKNAEGTYTVMPSEGMAMKMAQLRPGQGAVAGADNYAQYLEQHQAQKIGSETIDGHTCDIYQYADPEVGGTTKVWVWTDKMFPIKFETDSSQGKMVTELTNIQLGAAIPDDAFQLPAGIQVMDMGSMMRGFQ